MKKEAVKKVIDGKKYTFGLMGVFASHKLLTKIIKLIGPAMSGLDMGGGKSIKDANIDIGMVVKGITEALDEDATEQIIEALGMNTTCEGVGLLTRQNIDAHYTGDLIHLYKVVAAALEVQFGDFFAEGGVFAGAKSLLEKDLTPAP